MADLSGMPLNQDLVETALVDLLPRGGAMTPETILAAVAGHFNLSREQLSSRDRSRHVALPRQVAMYLIREETRASLPQIGMALGGRDHTTVMYGCGKITDLLETDDGLRRQVMAIREAIYQQIGARV
jgi:chromosomal replication initiator protein